jgi:hypothetical protein
MQYWRQGRHRSQVPERYQAQDETGEQRPGGECA